MSPLPILTVASRRQLPALHAFASSLAETGIDASLTAVIVDDPSLAGPREAAPRLVLEAPRVVVDHLDDLRVLCRTGPKLAHAAAPSVALAMVEERQSGFAVMSPATWIAGPIDVLAAASEHPASLVPTRLAVHPGDTLQRAFQRSCLFVRPGAEPLLRWWSEREFDHVVGRSGLGSLEEAAAAVPHAVLRDPGLGVDAWNATERVVPGGRPTATGGGPLRTFHLDEFDPSLPHLAVAVPGVAPPVLLSQHPYLRHLHERYAALLMDAGYERAAIERYAWDTLPGGFPLDAAARHAYATALRAHRQDRGPRPPNPFVDKLVTPFVEFLNEPAPEIARTYSRYVWALYETWPGLPAVFPDVAGKDREHFVWWLNRYARSDCPISSAIELPRRVCWPRLSAARGFGVNVGGYLGADSGLAVSARRTVGALETAGVEVRPVTYRRTMSRQNDAADDHGTTALFDVSVVCVTAEQFPLFHADMGREFFESRYTIGYWYWELEVLPEDQRGALDLVDEVWVATAHVGEAVRPLTEKPVHHMPIPLLAPRPSCRTRASFGLDDGYAFLFTFDFDSVMERKNPLGVVSAFTAAFPTPGDARLLLKSVNASRWPAEAELVRCAIADRADISMMDGYLSTPDQAALVAAIDCYVSLHRAEGLGLTLADAMALGKPVIATRYSGNLDFMDDRNSFLVPFRYAEVPSGTSAYPAGARWADPDIDEAARRMRHLASSPEIGRRLGAVARRDILQDWTEAKMGARMRSRLEEVWALW
jgi:glycosyltransferase involved in cell wall biosynthesis